MKKLKRIRVVISEEVRRVDGRTRDIKFAMISAVVIFGCLVVVLVFRWELAGVIGGMAWSLADLFNSKFPMKR